MRTENFPETSADVVPSTSMTSKKFRQLPEVEGFYRFIYENNLREEALEIIDKVLAEKRARQIMAGK